MYRMETVTSADGTELPVGNRDAGKRAPVVLAFVGNTGSRTDSGPVYQALSGAGATVIAAPWRGAGGIEGSRREAVFRMDARAVLDAVPDILGRDPGEVHLAGYPLGTGLSLGLSAERGQGASFWVRPMRGSARSHRNAPICLSVFPWVDQRDSLVLAGSGRTPVTILHGVEDRVIPADQRRKLPSRLEETGRAFGFGPVPGAGHGDVLLRYRARREVSRCVGTMDQGGGSTSGLAGAD